MRSFVTIARCPCVSLVLTLLWIAGASFAPIAIAANDRDGESNFAVLRFDFGSGKVAKGFLGVDHADAYSTQRSYGLEPNAELRDVDQHGDPLIGDYCTSDKPFYFSVEVPEGNYRVQVTTPQLGEPSPVTIKAELRRLVVEQSSDHEFQFTVNVRSPTLANGTQVRLKEREKTKEAWAWDDRLTLEFNGPHPAIASLTIEPMADAITIFLSGDSTVADQPIEPWNSWGQMLPRFFHPPVVVANHAESGETVKGSLGARRFDKIFEQAHAGDYLLMQFGHNDMKDKAEDAVERYRENLLRIVQTAKAKGMTTVLVTSMERKSGIDGNTLGRYPQTVRDVAQEMDVPLIDLHAASKRLYRGMGDDIAHAFVDSTHHRSYGSYQLARYVAAELSSKCPQLKTLIVDDVPAIDLDHPDPADQWQLPASPNWDDSVDR